MQRINRPTQLLREIYFSRLAESGNGFSGARVECNKFPPRVDEHAPIISILPRGYATMHETGAVGRLTAAPYFGIVSPELLASARVQCRDCRIRRGHVHRIANNDGRRLKLTGPRGLLSRCGGDSALARAPRPRNFQLVHVCAVHITERRPSHRAGITTGSQPSNLLRRQRCDARLHCTNQRCGEHYAHDHGYFRSGPAPSGGSRWITPPFITNTTRINASGSVRGSPSNATRSA